MSARGYTVETILDADLGVLDSDLVRDIINFLADDRPDLLVALAVEVGELTRHDQSRPGGSVDIVYRTRSAP